MYTCSVCCCCHRGDFILDEHVALFDKYDSWRMKEYAAFRRQRLDSILL